MKVRIGIGAGGDDLGPDAMAALGRAISGCGFDSLWLPEVLSRPGPGSPGRPGLGLGGLPGPQDRHDHAAPGAESGLAGQGGRPRSTCSRAAASFSPSCPGLAIGGERTAVGIPPAERGALMDEALPVLRRLWAGETVSHDGPSGSFTDVSVSPRPVQDPFDVWLGGNAPARSSAAAASATAGSPPCARPRTRRRGRR